MTREAALAQAAGHFDSGDFVRDLSRRVAFRTASQEPDSGPALASYLHDEIGPSLARLGFNFGIHPNPEPAYGPLLVASRHEGDDLPTVLMYGHGDVIRGQEKSWTCGQGPWTLAVEGERLYGRGTADNKGQHSINIAALATVLALRGQLGFNVKWLLETGEETGSPGLAAFCAAHQELLAADVLIASDGPRVGRDQPTVFLGSRGVANFSLTLNLRGGGGHHSGNWGGLLRNPGTVLANAIASMVDAHGVIRVQGLRPPPIPNNVRTALQGLKFGGDAGDPEVDPGWGEPGLTPAERVIAWNTLEVLAYKTGNPDFPVNAIPPAAQAFMHMRFVVGTDVSRLRDVVQQHLSAHGFEGIEVSEPEVMHATRLDPDNAWVRFTLASIEQSTGKKPVLLPNLGGSLPNDVFADILGLPTVWVPHSYAACQQHAPDEHMLAPVAREALQLMTGLFWDLAAAAPALPRR